MEHRMIEVEDNSEKQTIGHINFKYDNIIVCSCELCGHYTYKFCPIRCPHCNAYIVEWIDER